MIKVKQKKCAVRSCRAPFTPRNSFHRVCSPRCAIAKMEEDKAKAAKNKEKAFNAQTRKMKAEMRDSDSSWWKGKAQKAFNEFIRLRDAEQGCVSCDKTNTWAGQWHASHFKSVGARPDLRFNEDNCHKACSICNNYLSGNVGPYRDRLLVKIGPERLQQLEIDPGVCRYTIDDYKRIYAEFKAKTKQLLKNNNSNLRCIHEI